VYSSFEDLKAAFGDYEAAERQSDWDNAKLAVPVGTVVIGCVVARFRFGVFCDIGVGFPALLEIVRIRDLTPEAYRTTEWCPIGSELSATVTGFADDGRQIGLSQLVE
jgi:ribosomal protein S1